MSLISLQVELSETVRQLRRIADALEILIPAKPTRADQSEKVSLADVSHVDPLRAEIERTSARMNPQRRYARTLESVSQQAKTPPAARESSIIGTSSVGEFDSEDPLDLPSWLEEDEDETRPGDRLGNSVGVP